MHRKFEAARRKITNFFKSSCKYLLKIFECERSLISKNACFNLADASVEDLKIAALEAAWAYHVMYSRNLII